MPAYQNYSTSLVSNDLATLGIVEGKKKLSSVQWKAACFADILTITILEVPSAQFYCELPQPLLLIIPNLSFL